ncbi:MAG: putative lipid II flippase FtsW [Defluviitaleaceae bacterium]|nr:putative lipid II flippase FtsW [Defluviitaleaceae bacterium]
MTGGRYAAPRRAEEEYYEPLHDYGTQTHDREQGYTRRRPRHKSDENIAPRAKQNVHIGNVDLTIYLVVTILVIIGVIMVFSASYITAANSPRFGNDSFHFLRRNIPFAIAGFIIMNLVSRISYSLIKDFAWVIYLVTLGLLAAVLIGGVAVGGATRWVELPIIGRFQPSEISKAALIFIIAYLVDKYPNALKTWTGFFILAGLTGSIVGLVILPGGFSSALILATIGFGMIFIASPYIWRFVVPGGIGVAAVAFYLWFDANFGGGFRGARVQAWRDPWSDELGIGFQTVNSLYAVGTGGWFGLGIGQSRQASFLPEPQNDMIFAIIVEELGLVGAGLILMLFAIFIWRGILVAMKAPDTFGSMIALGVVFAIAFQTVINVAVVTNTIPNTGVTLPFISYGGTSLMVSMALAGVLLNISKHSKVRR